MTSKVVLFAFLLLAGNPCAFSQGLSQGQLLQADDGKLYGLCEAGPITSAGKVVKFNLFEYDPLSNAYRGDTNGSPMGGLVQTKNKKLFAILPNGNRRPPFRGKSRGIIVVQYETSDSTFVRIKEISGGANGEEPAGGLMEAANGKLYGLTRYGGVNDLGVLFEYDPQQETYLKCIDFDGVGNGATPLFNKLMQASNGKLYGMTDRGGINDQGIIFEYDPLTNVLINRKNFDGLTGAYPAGGLVQAPNGKLYGMTKQGGVNDRGVLFEFDPASNGYEKKLDFSEGANPSGDLIVDSGMLLGMTYNGGHDGVGIIFEYDPTNNTLRRLVYFSSTCYNLCLGSHPMGTLVKTSNGKIYGLTSEGGAHSLGVLFEFDRPSGTYKKKIDFKYNAFRAISLKR